VGLTRDYWTTNNAGPLRPAHCSAFGTAVVTRLVKTGHWRSGGWMPWARRAGWG